VRKLLAFAVFVEIGTGVLLLVDPALVVALLIGGDLSGAGVVAARCFGIALIALGLACWPGRQPAGDVAAAVRGMLLYNAAIALYLAYLGVAAHVGGPLLWPAAVLHAVVTVLLLMARQREKRVEPSDD
jgi:hypothetical protein